MGKRLSSRVIKIIIIMQIINLSFFNIANAGNCTRVARDCIEPGGTREINGFKVHRDCWQYRDSYKCSGYSKNNCSEYKEAMDCREDKSKCINTIGGNGKQEWCLTQEKKFTCIEAENFKRKVTKYRVPSYKQDNKLDRKRVKCNENVKCIDGKCVNWSNQVDEDKEKAWAMLKAIGEMKPEGSPEPVIFTGQRRKCTKKLYGLNNCCKPGKSLAQKTGFSSCSPNEKQINELKAEGRCHYIGSYKSKFHWGQMAEETMGGAAYGAFAWGSAGLGAAAGAAVGGIAGMVKKRVNYVYCCFDSKMAAEIQIQGRAQSQIDKPWGTAKKPNCSGFTPEELQAIDFEKIDFNFLAKDIKGKMDDIIDKLKETMNKFEGDVKNEFSVIQDSLKKRGSEEDRMAKQSDSASKQTEEEKNSETNPKPEGRKESRDKDGIL